MVKKITVYVDFFTVSVVWELQRYLSKEILWKNLNFSSLFNRFNFAKWTFIKRFPLTIALLIKRFYTKLKRFIVNITVSHSGFTPFTLKYTLQCMCMHTHYKYYLGNIQVISFFHVSLLLLLLLLSFSHLCLSLTLFLSVSFMMSVVVYLFEGLFTNNYLTFLFLFFFFGLLSLLLFYLLFILFYFIIIVFLLHACVHVVVIIVIVA